MTNADGLEATELPAVRRLRHDLLTPLNQIIGYCDLIAADFDESGEKRAKRSIAEASAAARRVISVLDEVIRLMIETSRATESVTLALNEINNQIYAAKSHSSVGTGDSFQSSVEMIHQATANLKSRLGELVGEFHGSTTDEELALIDRIDAEIPSVKSPGEAESASILVVDDNPMNRDLVVQHLSRSGHQATEADSGMSGLEMMRSSDFDLVLLDIMMPEMDGFEVLEKMASDERLNETPVIVLTSLDEVDAATACLQMGADDFMSKPFDVSVLLARIGAVLGRERRRTPAITQADVTSAEERRAVDSLSDREKEVLGLVATGRGNADIAEILFLSRFTVIRHVSNIYEKIQARNRSDATAFAHRHGMVASIKG